MPLILKQVYEAEGVNVPRTDFKDNQPTLDLLELKGTGLFPMLDEEVCVCEGEKWSERGVGALLFDLNRENAF